MKKRTSSNRNKKMAVIEIRKWLLWCLLYLISIIAVAASTGTSNSANTGSKDSEKSSESINHDGQRGNIIVPDIKENANHSTVTAASTAA